jgi:hypothetical protein
MPTDFGLKEEREWTPAARMRFWKSRGQRIAAGDSSAKPPRWHALDDPMTPEQRYAIPDGGPHESRSVPLWLKFRRPERLQEIVVARGYFDFDEGIWTTRLRPDENAGHCGCVRPEGWAPIVPEEPPPEWFGPMIQRERDS